VSNIASKLELHLNRTHLPTAIYRRLSEPRPDTAIGYMVSLEAQAQVPPLETAFSGLEELVFSVFNANSVIHFPFLTSQWKPAAGNPHVIAQNQSARDGAAIVNYLHAFYSAAYSRLPTTIEAAHFSVTCDTQSVLIWVHWREDEEGVIKHYMQHLFDATLRQEQMLGRAPEILWNIVDHALGPVCNPSSRYCLSS
jgi:hypothetical protein